MNKRLSASKRVTLGAMVSALTVLCLYAAAVLPSGRLAMYFLSSVFIYALACEGAYGSALLSYLTSAGLAFLLLPDKLPVLAHAVLLGHYGIFRTAVNTRMGKKLLPFLLRLLYCNVFAGLALYLAQALLGNLPFTAPSWLPAWALVLASQAGFIVYDLLYGLAAAIYESRLRRVIMPRR